MIEIRQDSLVFEFPEVHPSARLTVSFQRTFRIPDDQQEYPLPPGFGTFPLRHVDDFAERVPHDWITHGGVMLPMYQSEALWINLRSSRDAERGVAYPFAVKIAAGKINAVSGGSWTDGLPRRPQGYVVVPEQPWLDGYCVKEGVIRQFVAMPLGEGYTAEEQISGRAEAGGLQILAVPMSREAFEARFPAKAREPGRVSESGYKCYFSCTSAGMGLAPGGRMRQQLYDDPYETGEWSSSVRSRCFVHICNSVQWRHVTRERPPTRPPTAAQYTEAGLPWFDCYRDTTPLTGSKVLAGLASVAALARRKKTSLAGNGPLDGIRVAPLRNGLRPGQVREWVECSDQPPKADGMK